jgi:hypothetical protein
VFETSACRLWGAAPALPRKASLLPARWHNRWRLPASGPQQVQQQQRNGLGRPLRGNGGALVRYFTIRSFNQENINISRAKSVWATTRTNEDKLSAAFTTADEVWDVS